MWRKDNRRAWVRPERRWPCCAPGAEMRRAARKACRVAESGLLLALKVSRAALDEGIRRLQKDLQAERRRRTFRKIEIQ
ncbi:MAG: hypothetical protein KAX19_12490 [Candidatus Brocadiae bacterium]|nr:hypothetical protein [Candidatus Brocadiia bacterium]